MTPYLHAISPFAPTSPWVPTPRACKWVGGPKICFCWQFLRSYSVIVYHLKGGGGLTAVWSDWCSAKNCTLASLPSLALSSTVPTSASCVQPLDWVYLRWKCQLRDWTLYSLTSDSSQIVTNSLSEGDFFGKPPKSLFFWIQGRVAVWKGMLLWFLQSHAWLSRSLATSAPLSLAESTYATALPYFLARKTARLG